MGEGDRGVGRRGVGGGEMDEGDRGEVRSRGRGNG